MLFLLALFLGMNVHVLFDWFDRHPKFYKRLADISVIKDETDEERALKFFIEISDKIHEEEQLLEID
ncbi:hypothetical protein KAW80_02405 [Candidatus Babeliales bacterium]|nr:hypothetical protein [Candidatus Babeliales bacterium]